MASYKTKSDQSPTQGGIPPLVLALVCIIAVLGMAITFFIGRATAPTQNGAGTTNAQNQNGGTETDFAPSQSDPKAVELLKKEVTTPDATGRSRGKADAPVTVIAYLDYSCPMCTKANTEVTSALEKYIADGKVRLEFRDMVIFQKYGSGIAAAGARAAAKQGKFWEFHQALFAGVDPSGHPQYTKDSVIGIAKKAGISNLDQFAADLDSPEITQAITAQTTHASSVLGINGTPFFIINKAVISGAQTSQFIAKTVDTQLAEAKK